MAITKSTPPQHPLRQRAENPPVHDAVHDSESLSPEQTQQLLHELKVHQAQLEMQNEELLCIQHELEASRARYFDLYDRAPVGYVTLNGQGIIQEANHTVARMLGLEQGALVNTSFTCWIYPGDQDVYYLCSKRQPDLSLPEKCELRLLHSNGSLLWVNLQTITAPNSEYRITVHDITRQKMAEESLQASEVRYRSIIEDQSEMICRYKPDGSLTFVNGAYARYYGKTEAELINKNFVPHIPEPDLKLIKRQLAKIAPKQPVAECVHRIENADGEFRWQRWTHRGIFADDGSAIEYQAVGYDITEKKLSALLLQARLRIGSYAVGHTSEELLTDLLDEVEALTGSQIGFLHFVDADQATITFQAWSSNTLTSICTAEGKGGHYPLVNAGVWADCIREKRAVIHNDYERLNNRKGLPPGHAHIQRELVVPVFRDDAIVAVLGVGNKATAYTNQDCETIQQLTGLVWDIIERKKIEEDLSASEVRFKKLLENIQNIAVQGYLLDGTVVFWNHASELLYGYSPDEAIGGNLLDLIIPPEMREGVIAAIRQMSESTEPIPPNELLLMRKDGSRVPVFSSHAIIGSNGDQRQLFCIDIDLTERRRADEALRSAFHYTRSLIEASLDPLATINTEGTITDVNEAFVAVTGIPRAELIDSEFAGFFTNKGKARDLYTRVFTENSLMNYPLVIRRADGQVTEVICNASVYKNERGMVKGVFAAARDVTDRNKAERALKRAHDHLESRVAKRTAELAHANEQIKNASFELIWAEERERERISGELHDQVGQSLLLAKMKLDAVAAGDTSDPLCSAAAQISELVATSISDLRSLTFKMRPPLLDTATFETVLEWLCSSLFDDYGLRVVYTHDHTHKPLPVELRYSLYHAVRELLLNVVKHAKTGYAELSLRTENCSLLISVVDHGIGFDHADSLMKHVSDGSYGLYSVGQRIEKIGGRFEVISAPGSGTSITVHVPYSD